MKYLNLGHRPYRQILDLQEELRAQVQRGEGEDTILFVEHPKVITEGRRDASGDYLKTQEELKSQGYDIEKIHRGGKLTYHGPGQLVVYFILKLTHYGLSVPQFVRKVEECAIQTLKHFGVSAQRREGCPGVWVEEKKIASIGLSVDRGVSMHGMALNVNPELENFEVIISCGMAGCQLTSIAQEQKIYPKLSEVAQIMQSTCEIQFKKK